MRKLKDVSIARYIITYLILLMLVFSLAMTFFMGLMANRAIYYEIQAMLIREMSRNNRDVKLEDGEIVSKAGFSSEVDGMYFQILDENGNLLLGREPEGVQINRRVESQRLRSFENAGEEYYIISRISNRLTQEAGQIIYNRCIVKKEDVESQFESIRRIFYGMIPAFLACVFLVGYLISRRISDPIIKMSRTAEEIGREGEPSERMQYEGRIRELKILADRNNYMLDQLEEMIESQKRFSSDVAHELRTPVSVLSAQCEYAKEYTNTKEEFDEAIDVIYRQTQRTKGVINQLLNLSRLESGRIVPELEEVDIDEMIRSICEEEEAKAEGEVRFNLSLAGVSAQADVGLIFIALSNLIQNAVKYSFLPAAVDISAKCVDNSIVISVRDYGRGIKKEDLEKIFQPFYRVDESRNSEGFGLGLSLAARIARIHGGKIDVESVENEGSVFTLSIPKKQS